MYMHATYAYIPSDIDLDTPPSMEHTFMLDVIVTFTHNDERKTLGHHQQTNNKHTTTPTTLSQRHNDHFPQYGPHTLITDY